MLKNGCKTIFYDEKKWNLDGPGGYKFYWYDWISNDLKCFSIKWTNIYGDL